MLSLIANHQICLYGLEHSLGIHGFRPNLAWSSMFLQLKQNLFNNPVTEQWSTVSSPIAQQMFLIASTALWPSLNS